MRKAVNKRSHSGLTAPNPAESHRIQPGSVTCSHERPERAQEYHSVAGSGAEVELELLWSCSQARVPGLGARPEQSGSNVVSELQLQGMGLEVHLPGQVELAIFSDVMVHEGKGHYERQLAFSEAVQDFRHLLFLVRR